MDKNKSIDGLNPRRVKKPSTHTQTASKKAPKKISVSTPAPKPTPAVKPHKTPKIDPVEDFLKPVQAFDFDEQSGELKASTDPINHKGKKMKKEKKPVSKKSKIITRTIITILSLLLIAAIVFVFWINGKIGNMTNEGSIFDFFTETYDPLKTDENGRTNILAFGTSGYDMEGTEGDSTHDGAQLTDSIMVISLNQETGDLAMLSLPRDLKVSSTCTATGKINEIYWCNNMDGNNDKAGAEALMQEVGDILGIDFQYYAHLNWGSLVSIVDILGGVTVTLDEDIEDYTYTGAVFQAGVPYTLDGAQALGLARARHGTTSGDFSRGASQQKILIGIKDRVFEKDLSVSDLLGLLDTLGNNFTSNFSVNELKTIAHFTSEFNFDDMRQVSLIEPENYMTTATINGISYVVPIGGAGYYNAIQEYVAKMFSSDPKVYENATILVLNGTETPGLATTEQAALTEDGYQNVSTGDAPTSTYTDQYTLYTTTNDKPGTKKLLEEKYHTTAEPAETIPAGIDTTYDFILILGNSDSTNN